MNLSIDGLSTQMTLAQGGVCPDCMLNSDVHLKGVGLAKSDTYSK